MDEVYCISYSDFGHLLMENSWELKIRRNDQCTGVYEDILRAGDITIVRRFVQGIPSLFAEDENHETVLPEGIERLELKKGELKVIVIGSFEFDSLFLDSQRDQNGFVKTTANKVEAKAYDGEALSEDVVILASDGRDLNSISSVELGV